MNKVNKAKAISVPESAPYITEGKVYDISGDESVVFSVVDEDGDNILCCFDGLCGHGISWERVL